MKLRYLSFLPYRILLNQTCIFLSFLTPHMSNTVRFCLIHKKFVYFEKSHKEAVSPRFTGPRSRKQRGDEYAALRVGRRSTANSQQPTVRPCIIQQRESLIPRDSGNLRPKTPRRTAHIREQGRLQVNKDGLYIKLQVRLKIK